ncbi:MAG: hypothetical protein JSV33_11585, partial [bacterium]
LVRYIRHVLMLILFCVCITWPVLGAGIDYELTGQLSGWFTERKVMGDWEYETGARYIPSLELMLLEGNGNLLDLEVSLNGSAIASSAYDEEADIELYRAKLRFATPRTETRFGMQKINFGPAYLLRSLMWFDRLDPRDPQQFTEGVYGLRFTYNTMNNASLWLWGLYGNDDTKGIELLPTADGRPEFGGRLQFPVPYGELAFAFHRRVVDASSIRSGDFLRALLGVPFPVTIAIDDFDENRFAFDGRFDVEIGLWFEMVFQHWHTAILPIEWTKLMTVGGDYTFGIGNGIHTILEYMAVATSESFVGWDRDTQISAVSMSYQLGILDRIQAIGIYHWDDEEYAQYLSWQRTWDTLVLNMNLFHYPETFGGGLPGGLGSATAPAGRTGPAAGFTGETMTGGGYGGQIIVIIYY